MSKERFNRKKGTQRLPDSIVLYICNEDTAEGSKQFLEELKARNRLPSFEIIQKKSYDTDTESILQYISNYKKRNQYPRDSIFYAVCDVDGKRIHDLQSHRKNAKDENIILLFSNPCFEIWFFFYNDKILPEFNKNHSKCKEEGQKFYNAQLKQEKDFFLLPQNLQQAMQKSKTIKRETGDDLDKSWTEIHDLLEKIQTSIQDFV